MRSAHLLLCTVLAAVLCTTLALVAQAPKADDREAIAARAAAFEAAWNSHDSKAIAACWAPEGDVINPFGRVARGTAQVTDLFAEEHAGPMKALKTSVKVVSTRLISPTVAVSDWEITLTGGTAPEGEGLIPWPLKHQAVVVLQRGPDGRWLFEAVRPYQFAAAPKGMEPPAGKRAPVESEK